MCAAFGTARKDVLQTCVVGGGELATGRGPDVGGVSGRMGNKCGNLEIWGFKQMGKPSDQ